MFEIKFEGKCDFLLREIEINKFSDTKIIKAQIKAEEGKFYCTFVTSHELENKAIYSTVNTIEHFKNIIIYETAYEIYGLEWNSVVNLGTENIAKSILLQSRISMEASIHVIKPIENPEDLKNKLMNSNTIGESNYSNLFIEIIKLKDGIGKYILFYSILSALIGNQKEVDNFIITKKMNVQMKPTSRQNANFDETIYTFIRNQIGHTEENTDTTQLANEIDSHIDELRKLVKQAIEENL